MIRYYVLAWAVTGWMVAFWAMQSFLGRLNRKYPTLPPNRMDGSGLMVCLFCGPVIWPFIGLTEVFDRIQERRYGQR